MAYTLMYERVALGEENAGTEPWHRPRYVRTQWTFGPSLSRLSGRVSISVHLPPRHQFKSIRLL